MGLLLLWIHYLLRNVDHIARFEHLTCRSTFATFDELALLVHMLRTKYALYELYTLCTYLYLLDHATTGIESAVLRGAEHGEMETPQSLSN